MRKGWLLIFLCLCFPLFGVELKEDLKKGIEQVNKTSKAYYEVLNHLGGLEFSTSQKKVLEKLLNKARKEYGNYTRSYQKWLNPQVSSLRKEAKEIAKFFYRDKEGNLRFDYQGYLEYIKGKNYRRIKLAQKKQKTVLILMSSSVPLQVWKTYICQVEDLKLKAKFVLRGFIGGIKSGIKPTLNFIQKLIKGWSCQGRTKDVHNVEIDIDPWVFRKYRINQVPAVIANGKISYGDYSLEWHLERLGLRVQTK